MTITPPRFQGLWLPLVTPFKDGQVDETSFRRLVDHYAGRVDGFILTATTGEGLALSRDETRRLTDWTAEILADRGRQTPVILGLCGASTAGVTEALRTAETWPVEGFLIAAPYYVRPSQDGLRQHFEILADSTAKDILVYNIPYRTGVNLANDTLRRLAERPNIVGVKDCCADPAQSLDLITNKPAGFSVLAGEDAGFLTAVRQGAEGGVTASGHIDPDGFRAVFDHARNAAWDEADRAWSRLAALPDLLFSEPSPGALKHALWRLGLIDSPELRLPMTPPSEALAQRVDTALAGLV